MILRACPTFFSLLSKQSTESSKYTQTTSPRGEMFGLNDLQIQAVTSPSAHALQVIAGPGTGKTKVLVARVAHLIEVEGISPQHIVVTTFTKKAANEMTERLNAHFRGSVDVSKLIIGTFHSICFRLLRAYGSLMNLRNPRIATDLDSKFMLKEVVDDLSGTDFGSDLEKFLKNGQGDDFDAKKLQREISKLKSSGLTASNYAQSTKKNHFLSQAFSLYQEKLQADNMLDFDDCLVECSRLLQLHPVLHFIKHVLVDEFQDTNDVQLQLVYELAKRTVELPEDSANYGVTVVGDPDQSIYAFRNAKSINFELMRLHFKGLRIVNLKENYRSTSHILKISEILMQQQTHGRLKKELRSQLDLSFAPVHNGDHVSQDSEAQWIVSQIKYLLELPGTIFKASDVAILLRAGSQSRLVEKHLITQKISYIMLKGRAFWERKEVLIVLNYIRAVANENDRVAYLKTLNYPKRGLGNKAMEDIEAVIKLRGPKEQINPGSRSDNRNSLSVHDTLMAIASREISAKILAKGIQEMGQYLEMISRYRATMGQENREDFLNELLKESGVFAEFEGDEFEEARLNIAEVVKLFAEFEPLVEQELPEGLPDNRNILEQYLQTVMLYESENDSSDTLKVNLCTIHGSKGLEWPVVFIPGNCEGVLPSRGALMDGTAKSVDEERRVLYVALTRAKILLYMSSFVDDSPRWGGESIGLSSRFMSKDLLRYTRPIQTAFESTERLQNLYNLLGRQISPGEISSFVQMYKSECIDKAIEKGINDRGDYNIETLDFRSAREPKLGHLLVPGLKRSKPVKREGFKAPRMAEASSGTHVPTKAPTYVPVRRVPASLQRVKQLHKVLHKIKK